MSRLAGPLVLALLCAGCGLFRSAPPPETPAPEPPPARTPGDPWAEPLPPDAPPEAEPATTDDEPDGPAVDMEVGPEAIEPAEPAPAGPEDAAAGALAARARAALAEGRTEEAIALLERALSIAPNRAPTYLDLARAYLGRGLGEQALGLVRRAELLLGGEDGLDRAGLRLKADCLEAAGQSEEADRVRRLAGGR